MTSFFTKQKKNQKFLFGIKKLYFYKINFLILFDSFFANSFCARYYHFILDLKSLSKEDEGLIVKELLDLFLVWSKDYSQQCIPYSVIKKIFFFSDLTFFVSLHRIFFFYIHFHFNFKEKQHRFESKALSFHKFDFATSWLLYKVKNKKKKYRDIYIYIYILTQKKNKKKMNMNKPPLMTR